MRVFAIQIVFLLGVFFHPVLAQDKGFKCPWDEVDCPGKCGRYFDADGDGFCDYGLLSKVVKKDTVVRKDTAAIKQVNSNKQVNPSTQNGNADVEGPGSDSMNADTAVVELKNDTPKPSKARSYSLLLISLLCFGLYGFTSFLYELKIYRKFVHRRIWNVLLLLTFLTTAVLGIILVVLINYQLDSTLIRDYLYWHVQFGIAMTVIALIHIVWHWKYFFRLFSKKSKSDCIS